MIALSTDTLALSGRVGVAASTLDGLLMGSGDAVIGLNPASDSMPVLGDLLRMLDEVIQRFGIPTQSCVLTHVTNTIKYLENLNFIACG